MQTLEIQQDVQAVQRTASAKNNDSEKKAASKDQSRVSFAEMMRKMMEKEQAEHQAVNNTEENMPVNEKLAGEKSTKKDPLLHQRNTKQKNAGEKKHIDMCAEAENMAESADLVDSESAGKLTALDAKIESNAALSVQTGESISGAAPEVAGAEETEVLKFDESLARKKDKKAPGAAEMAMGKHDEPDIKEEQLQELLNEKDNQRFDEKVKAPVKQQKPLFTVVDERAAQAVASDSSVHEAGQAVRVENVKTPELMLEAGTGQPMVKMESGSFVQETGSKSFAAQLTQQLQDMSSDFVQAGRIILQNNNSGIIRLQMQPAYLGSVKINLELTEGKKVLGKIVAGSKETYEAFKKNIDQLAKAFELGGFDSASFDVSWSGESGGGFAQNDREFSQTFGQNPHLEVMQEKRYADTQSVYSFDGHMAVNVLA